MHRGQRLCLQPLTIFNVSVASDLIDGPCFLTLRTAIWNSRKMAPISRQTSGNRPCLPGPEFILDVLSPDRQACYSIDHHLGMELAKGINRPRKRNNAV